MYSPLQLREIFHLEFLRWFGHKVEAEYYALKGGVNIRFFFNSFRYSEDMDLDVHGIKVDTLRDIVMGILYNKSFLQDLTPYNIERVIPPDITKAKQTETTQRFKVHLITFAGEDLFTKVEFSRRGLMGGVIVQSVSDAILRPYRLSPLLVPHYSIQSTIVQKIGAIASRSVIQARDILDLYVLSSQYGDIKTIEWEKVEKNKLVKAYENIFEVSFKQFQDTVVSYLLPEDQLIYKKDSTWDEVKLKTASFIDGLRKRYA